METNRLADWASGYTSTGAHVVYAGSRTVLRADDYLPFYTRQAIVTLAQAAPDMLAVCRATVAHWEEFMKVATVQIDDPPHIVAAKAAIKKATTLPEDV